jgi:transcriptional regulator with XRE-family HTH domain
MDNEHLPPSAFADYLQLGRAVISHILNGRNNPSLEVVTRILTKMDYINPNWLITGEGEMYKDGYTKGNQLPFDTNVNYSKEENKIFAQLENDNSNSSNPPNLSVSSAQNPVSVSSEPNQTEYRKEIIVEQPQKLDENLSSKQILYQNKPDKKISKIIIYYSDKTFESFSPDNHPL